MLSVGVPTVVVVAGGQCRSHQPMATPADAAEGQDMAAPANAKMATRNKPFVNMAMCLLLGDPAARRDQPTTHSLQPSHQMQQESGVTQGIGWAPDPPRIVVGTTDQRDDGLACSCGCRRPCPLW